MRSLILALAFITSPIAAMAACTVQTYYIDGQYVRCTVCCDARGNCRTTCY